MSLIDCLASEYGRHPNEIRRLPLAEALCYHNAILQRHEVDLKAPTFAERDLIDAWY